MKSIASKLPRELNYEQYKNSLRLAAWKRRKSAYYYATAFRIMVKDLTLKKDHGMPSLPISRSDTVKFKKAKIF